MPVITLHSTLLSPQDTAKVGGGRNYCIHQLSPCSLFLLATILLCTSTCQEMTCISSYVVRMQLHAIYLWFELL